MEMIIPPGGLLMTSREMAVLTEKRHDNVKRTIDSLADSGSISHPQIEDGVKAANGVTEQVYHVGKRDSYVVVAQLSPLMTARLVDRWQELEAIVAAPPVPTVMTRLELIQMMLVVETENLGLTAKIIADAPKVLFAETIRAIDGLCHIEKIGKMIGIGRTKLFARMREDKILIKGSRMPFQKYIDKGYFTVVEGAPYPDSKGVKHPTFTTMVTGAGQIFLVRRYTKAAEADL